MCLLLLRSILSLLATGYQIRLTPDGLGFHSRIVAPFWLLVGLILLGILDQTFDAFFVLSVTVLLLKGFLCRIPLCLLLVCAWIIYRGVSPSRSLTRRTLLWMNLLSSPLWMT